MNKIIIVSGDICAIKQIINCINNLKRLNPPSIKIMDILDLREYIASSNFTEQGTIYFIDIYDIEHEFLDIISAIRKKDKKGNIIILNINSNLKSLLNSQSKIYAYVNKNFNFNHKLIEVLTMLENGENSKINVSDIKTPILINKKLIKRIYHWPTGEFSISYEKDDNIFVSFKQGSKKIKQITQNNFYIDNLESINKKRRYYSEPFKQMLVDLYLIYHMDYKILSKSFNVDDANYIKKWSNLQKYQTKLNILQFWIGKLIINHYFKKRGRN